MDAIDDWAFTQGNSGVVLIEVFRRDTQTDEEDLCQRCSVCWDNERGNDRDE